MDAIATMRPVRGRIDTIAASGSPGVRRTSCIASRACACSFGSSVVWIRSPPARTAAEPKSGSAASSFAT